MGLALPFVIGPTLSLKSGVTVSLLIVIATLPVVILSTLIPKKTPLEYKMVCYMILSMCCVTFFGYRLQAYPMMVESLGIYLPLAAVNSLMYESVMKNQEENAKDKIINALKMCLGFALVVCAVSAFREVLGNKTIWGVPFTIYPIKMQGVNLPFFGLIVLGFMGAMFRSIDRLISKILLNRGIREKNLKAVNKNVR